MFPFTYEAQSIEIKFDNLSKESEPLSIDFNDFPMSFKVLNEEYKDVIQSMCNQFVQLRYQLELSSALQSIEDRI